MRNPKNVEKENGKGRISSELNELWTTNRLTQTSLPLSKLEISWTFSNVRKLVHTTSLDKKLLCLNLAGVCCNFYCEAQWQNLKFLDKTKEWKYVEDPVLSPQCTHNCILHRILAGNSLLRCCIHSYVPYQDQDLDKSVIILNSVKHYRDIIQSMLLLRRTLRTFLILGYMS